MIWSNLSRKQIKLVPAGTPLMIQSVQEILEKKLIQKVSFVQKANKIGIHRHRFLHQFMILFLSLILYHTCINKRLLPKYTMLIESEILNLYAWILLVIILVWFFFRSVISKC